MVTLKPIMIQRTSKRFATSTGFGQYSRRASFAMLAALLLFASVVPAIAQDDNAKQPSSTDVKPNTLTVETVAAQIKQIEADTEVEEGLKAKLLQAYRLAETQLNAASAFQQRGAALKQQIADAPQGTERFQKQLEETPALTEAKAAELPELKVGDPSKALAAYQAENTTWKTKLTALETSLKDIVIRPTKGREELAAAKLKLEQIEKELKTPAPADEPEALTEARLATLNAFQRARTAEIASLEQELIGHDARLAFLTAERDLVARQVANAEIKIKVLQAEVNLRKQNEAEAARLAAVQAKRDAIGKHRDIIKLADANAELSTKLTVVLKRAQRVAELDAEAVKDLKDLDQKYEDAKKKIEVAGLSETLGRILREQRNNLPNIKDFQRDAAERSKELSTVGLYQLNIDDQRRKMPDVDVAVEQRMKTIKASIDPSQRDDIESEIRKLMTSKKELLDKLGPAYSSYVNALGELDFQQKQLIDKAAEYATFLDERLLWIPSAKMISGETFDRFVDDFEWLTLPDNWGKLIESLQSQIRSEFISTILVIVLFTTLLALRRWMRHRVEQLNEHVGKATTDSFRWTTFALVTVLLAALPWPLLMGHVGRLLREDFTASVFVRGFGDGLVVAAMLLYPILAMARFCSKSGVARIHLRWSDRSTSVLRHNLWWLGIVAPIFAFLITFADWQADDAEQHSLGRVAFIGVMMAFAFFNVRALHPRKGAISNAIERHPESLLARTRIVWYFIAVGLPLVLAVLAAVGYVYTAQQLEHRLLLTIYIILTAVIVNDLVMRALMLMRVRLAMKQNEDKRAAAKAAREAEADGEGDEEVMISADAKTIDLAAVNEQTRQFVRALIGVTLFLALWGVWSGVLPALGILDQIELWNQSKVVAGQPTIVPITLKSLGLALLACVITVVAARNLPGAMDMIVLGRLPIDSGTRYAISTISRYVIVGVGVVLAFGMIGLGWSQVQWLIAALTVGLGFGLQEIFANFVSGLIILIERPVRVGDTVTVGDTSGIVSRIRIRATTITDWNRKELIVPNKRFITEEVINWTLSDPVTRLDILVGIAYGSDTELALKTMNETVRDVPGVIDAPEPEVFFLGFGDNTLNFEVRAYVKEMTNKGRTKVVHGIHMAIDREFRKHDICIAFPQRDLHIKSAEVPINIIAQMQNSSGVNPAK